MTLARSGRASRTAARRPIDGGVERRSRDILRRTARSCGAAVVETPLRGRNVDDYVEQKIIPRISGRKLGQEIGKSK